MDIVYSMWALAWQTHALLAEPGRYFDANIYHPVANALAYGPTATGALPLFGPVFAVTRNPVLATDVLFIGGSALTAWTIGLVTARWTRSMAASLVAGATYLATPWVLHDWVPLCPHHALLMWVPLIIEAVARPTIGWRDAAALAVMMALQGSVEIVYIAPAIVLPVALIAVARMARSGTRGAGMRLAAALLAAGLAWTPMLARYAAVRRAEPGLPLQSTWVDAPTQLPTVSALLVRWKVAGGKGTWPSPMAIPPLGFALVAAGALVLCARRRSSDETSRRAWTHAALWTAIGAAIGLPDSLSVFGTPIVRVPVRLAVIGLVGLSLLAGLAFAELTRASLGRAWARSPVRMLIGAAAAVMAIVLIEEPGQGWGYPPGAFVQPRMPTAYRYRAWENPPYAALLFAGHGPLLEIGMNLSTFPPFRAWWEVGAMARSIGHWRPLLNGYSSYWPAQYERSMALAQRLPTDGDALATLHRETGVELILVWLRHLEPPVRKEWEALARTGGNAGMALIGEGEQDTVLFRVTDTS